MSTGSPGSGTEIMAFRVLEAAGIDGKKDIKQERLGAAESVNAIKDRKIDAFFWVGGVPTAAVTDLAATPGIKIKLIDHAEVVDAMNKKYGPLYVKSVIPAGSYPGQDKPNAEVDVWNILVTNDKMSDQMAYTIVKTLFEKKAELVAVHKEAKNIELKSQALGSPIPFHPGAKKYLEEQGVKVELTPMARHRAPAAGSADDGDGMASAHRASRAVADERLQQAATYIEAEEGATSRYRGWLARPRDRAARRHVAVPPLRGGRRSFPRRCCARSTSAGRCCSSSCCSRSPRASATG